MNKVILNKDMIEAIKKAQKIGLVKVSVQPKQGVLIASYSNTVFYNAGFQSSNTEEMSFNLDDNMVQAIALAGDSVELSKSAEGTITIKSGTYKVSDKEIEIKEETSVAVEEAKTIKKIIAFNLDDINKVDYVASLVAENTAIWNGVNFKTKGDELTVSASDSSRISILKMKVSVLSNKSSEEISATVDRKVLDFAKNLLCGDVTLSFSENAMFFTKDNELMGLQTMSIKYPPVEVIETTTKQNSINTITVNRKQLQTAISRITLNKECGLEIKGENNKCFLNSFNMKNTSIMLKDAIDAKFSKEFDFKINPRFLKELLSHINDEEIIIQFSDDPIKAILIVVEGVSNIIALCTNVKPQKPNEN